MLGCYCHSMQVILDTQCKSVCSRYLFPVLYVLLAVHCYRERDFFIINISNVFS